MKLIKLYLLFILFCFSNLAFAKNNTPILKVGILSDVQYADAEPNGKREYRKSLKRLDNVVSNFNSSNLDFAINLGDIVDRDINKTLPLVINGFKKLNTKVYQVFGNHEIASMYQEKDGYKGEKGDRALNLVLKDLSMPNSYYSIKKKNVVFVMLNTNETAKYSIDKTAKNSKSKTKEFNDIKKHAIKTKRNSVDGIDYNGALGKTQLNWLKNILDTAEKEGNIVLLFSHHPPYPEKSLQILDNKELLNLIEKYKSVKAYFAGHDHDGGFFNYKNIPIIIQEGLVDGLGYSILSIYPNKLVIKGYGRTQSKIIGF